MRPRTRMLFIFLAACVLACSGCSHEGNERDFIDDRAGLLTGGEKDRLARLGKKLLEDMDIHIKTVVLEKSPVDITDKAVDIFDRSELGKKTGGSRGALFLIDSSGRRVRLEIGYDLEGVSPDGFVGYIERRQMVPFFASGKVGNGIEAAYELLVEKAYGATDVEHEEPCNGKKTDTVHYSGGAGAETTIEIGGGALEKGRSALAAEFHAQPSPLATLEKYGEVLRLRIKDPDLELYTPESRLFFAGWTVTDAQQDNESRKLESDLAAAEVITVEDRAVIRFPLHDRGSNPYFLVRGADGWMLDFAGMNRVIGFNHKNQWFFRSQEHPYLFAFDDVYCDRNGFPHEKQR
ncbi:MAG: hypothetical protein AVO39_05220 [delta proteobacterium MLS_D]|jgi:uncharacterized protein|nr:MAG: hypothetical protein AVO39_05220 [delta proteobacterium MLS_D]